LIAENGHGLPIIDRDWSISAIRAGVPRLFVGTISYFPAVFIVENGPGLWSIAAHKATMGGGGRDP
jgi:hypothetical protein